MVRMGLYTSNGLGGGFSKLFYMHTFPQALNIKFILIFIFNKISVHALYFAIFFAVKYWKIFELYVCMLYV